MWQEKSIKGSFQFDVQSNTTKEKKRRDFGSADNVITSKNNEIYKTQQNFNDPQEVNAIQNFQNSSLQSSVKNTKSFATPAMRKGDHKIDQVRDAELQRRYDELAEWKDEYQNYIPYFSKMNTQTFMKKFEKYEERIQFFLESGLFDTSKLEEILHSHFSQAYIQYFSDNMDTQTFMEEFKKVEEDLQSLLDSGFDTFELEKILYFHISQLKPDECNALMSIIKERYEMHLASKDLQEVNVTQNFQNCFAMPAMRKGHHKSDQARDAELQRRYDELDEWKDEYQNYIQYFSEMNSQTFMEEFEEHEERIQFFLESGLFDTSKLEEILCSHFSQFYIQYFSDNMDTQTFMEDFKEAEEDLQSLLDSEFDTFELEKTLCSHISKLSPAECNETMTFIKEHYKKSSEKLVKECQGYIAHYNSSKMKPWQFMQDFKRDKERIQLLLDNGFDGSYELEKTLYAHIRKLPSNECDDETIKDIKKRYEGYLTKECQDYIRNFSSIFPKEKFKDAFKNHKKRIQIFLDSGIDTFELERKLYPHINELPSADCNELKKRYETHLINYFRSEKMTPEIFAEELRRHQENIRSCISSEGEQQDTVVLALHSRISKFQFGSNLPEHKFRDKKSLLLELSEVSRDKLIMDIEKRYKKSSETLAKEYQGYIDYYNSSKMAPQQFKEKFETQGERIRLLLENGFATYELAYELEKVLYSHISKLPPAECNETMTFIKERYKKSSEALAKDCQDYIAHYNSSKMDSGQFMKDFKKHGKRIQLLLDNGFDTSYELEKMLYSHISNSKYNDNECKLLMESIKERYKDHQKIFVNVCLNVFSSNRMNPQNFETALKQNEKMLRFIFTNNDNGFDETYELEKMLYSHISQVNDQVNDNECKGLIRLIKERYEKSSGARANECQDYIDYYNSSKMDPWQFMEDFKRDEKRIRFLFDSGSDTDGIEFFGPIHYYKNEVARLNQKLFELEKTLHLHIRKLPSNECNDETIKNIKKRYETHLANNCIRIFSSTEMASWAFMEKFKKNKEEIRCLLESEVDTSELERKLKFHIGKLDRYERYEFQDYIKNDSTIKKYLQDDNESQDSIFNRIFNRFL